MTIVAWLASKRFVCCLNQLNIWWKFLVKNRIVSPHPRPPHPWTWRHFKTTPVRIQLEQHLGVLDQQLDFVSEAQGDRPLAQQPSDHLQRHSQELDHHEAGRSRWSSQRWRSRQHTGRHPWRQSVALRLQHHGGRQLHQRDLRHVPVRFRPTLIC